MPFTGDTFTHLFSWDQDPQRQEKIVNARLEAEFDGIDTGLSATAARVTVLEGSSATGTDLVSTGSSYVQIDSDNNATDRVFQVRKDSATPGAGTLLFEVSETGKVVIGTTTVSENRKFYVNQVDTDSTGGATAHSAIECREDWQPGANSDGNATGCYGTLWMNSAADFTGHNAAVRGNAYTIAQGGGGSVNVTNLVGTYGRVRHEAAGTITNAIALHADGAQDAGGTITNAMGVYIGAQTAATNNYGVYFEDNPGAGSIAAAANTTISTKVTGTGTLTWNTAGGQMLLNAAGALSAPGAITGGNITASASGTFSQLTCARTDTHGSSATISLIAFQGRDSGAAAETYGRIIAIANDDTATSEDGSFTFDTRVAGTLATRVTFGQGVQVGAPTGGDKGVGTLNATAVYDDNTLLTDVVQEWAEKGSVDLGRWDSMVPDLKIPEVREEVEVGTDLFPVFDEHGNGVDAVERPVFEQKVTVPAKIIKREHYGARIFKSLLDGGLNPRDPASFVAYVKERKALPGLPTEQEWEQGKFSIGEMQTRSTLAMEILTQAFIGLSERVADIERTRGRA